MQVLKSLTLCTLTVSGFLLALFSVCAAQEIPYVATEDNRRIADTQSNEGAHSKLPANALQMARIIGVESHIEKLSSLSPAKEAGAAPVLSLEELSLRQRINQAVTVASLDVDSVVAEIDYEREQTVELRSISRYKRDRAIGTTNVLFWRLALDCGIVSGLLQFSKTTSSAGNAVGFAAGGISTLFSLRSFRQVHGGKRPAWVLPNMLAPSLRQSDEQHSHYPDHIWAYLSTVPAGAASQATRKEQMFAGWVAAGRIAPPNSSQWKRRIDLLTSTNAADKDLNIELMNERAAMLADLANQVSLMKRSRRSASRVTVIAG